MTGRFFDWNGSAIPFREGETIAAALTGAGILHLGDDSVGSEARYFCGIGACQNCLVRVNGAIREACLTRAVAGLSVACVERRDHD
ncbi:2Fe-2S iron-sulfur cluster-binding protein [Shinella fusca]|jgi:aerobic-type carbon monoxide dehydrogenase small subunit (CoxS/CutS family)|uniref:Aerobic-type carbon monoxide dehydrogenase small subunit (CoxS/CutS family) n=1 Tax=Shinella fusca TaxID=544480 RepID=A0A7W7YSF4_9HYPH|nr:2Fe-2S iron-sulfur cluster-binding protein [Shinella fusca]MBB5041498.1 aerobic-type carbon monoxide dehydrogenase small subunit (CoxS/CutS family) [Shinella fusca]